MPAEGNWVAAQMELQKANMSLFLISARFQVSPSHPLPHLLTYITAGGDLLHCQFFALRFLFLRQPTCDALIYLATRSIFTLGLRGVWLFFFSTTACVEPHWMYIDLPTFRAPVPFKHGSSIVTYAPYSRHFTFSLILPVIYSFTWSWAACCEKLPRGIFLCCTSQSSRINHLNSYPPKILLPPPCVCAIRVRTLTMSSLLLRAR